ncbi:P-loop containing nucleoside triphosphate hydrolase protein [Mycena rebaudengoi]|nr:P-loop containing nucleoside triphosphate hydrolase protein [Mycena rebaudengoi]
MGSNQPLLAGTSLPSYNVRTDDSDSVPDVCPPAAETVKQFSWGIFKVAYGAPERRFSCLRDLRRNTPGAARLFCEIYWIAYTPVTIYLLSSMLLTAAPAFSLYIAATVLTIVEESSMLRGSNDMNANMLQALVFMWLFIAVMTTVATRIMDDAIFALKGHLRAHFLPPLVRGRSLFPDEYGFDSVVPAFQFFHEIVTRLRNFLTVIAEVTVMAMVISRRGIYEVAFFCVMIPIVMLGKPITGVNGAGYVFWTHNQRYYELAALYKMAFSTDLRPMLARDGLCPFVADEYTRVSAELGPTNVETITISSTIRVQWYWEMLHTIILDYPLAICVLTLPWSGSLSWLVTMVFLQHATMTLKQSIYQLRGSEGPDSLAEVFGMADSLYEAIALDTNLYRGVVNYDPSASHPAGMKLEFKNVSLQLSAQGSPADVSFEIAPGSLVLIVGANGSGKSSLLSLLPRIREPSSGEILIDGKPLREYEVESVRRAMACLSQDEDVYPLSVRDNILLGERPDPEMDPERIDEAALLGGAYQFIHSLTDEKTLKKTLRHYAVLDPAPVTGMSMQGCGNGLPTIAAMEQLEDNTPSTRPVSMSAGERQRLAATRLFARLLRNTDVRLILCDEATGALDSPAEDMILDRLAEQKTQGKTVVLVTHRWARSLASKADVIVVMAEGKVVQTGKHDDLISDGEGEYAKIYCAQV